MTIRLVRRFVALLFDIAPRTTLMSAALALLTAITEGIGILLLIPLLSLAGILPSAQDFGGLMHGMTAWLPSSLGLVLLLYVGIVAMRVSIEYASTAAAARVEAELMHTLATRLHTALLQARWEEVVRIKGTRVSYVLTREIERVAVAANQLFSGVLELANVVTYAMAAILVSPALALIASAVAAALLVFLRRQRRNAARDGERITDLGTDLFTGSTEALSMLRLARTSGAANTMAERFTTNSRSYTRALAAAQRRHASSSALMMIGAALALAVVVYLGVTVLHLDAARLLMVIFLCARLVPRITAVQARLMVAANALPAVAETDALLAELRAAREDEEALDGAAIVLQHHIEVNEVTYGYPHAQRDALSGVSCTIPAGSITAIVGASGAGKSTLADIVLGLLEPSSGALLVDDVPLDSQRRARWHKSIAYVPQDSPLLHDSIRANVEWAEASPSKSETLSALERAGATPLLSRLPAGAETIVGDRGALLSGGERQRIALARALVRHPRLLVLDEATNALDAQSESAFLDTLTALLPSITVIMITHRIATARRADHMILLEGGRVLREGAAVDVLGSIDEIPTHT
jgi:ATP-binding cassette subfamily C protein